MPPVSTTHPPAASTNLAQFASNVHVYTTNPFPSLRDSNQWKMIRAIIDPVAGSIAYPFTDADRDGFADLILADLGNDVKLRGISGLRRLGSPPSAGVIPQPIIPGTGIPGIVYIGDGLDNRVIGDTLFVNPMAVIIERNAGDSVFVAAHFLRGDDPSQNVRVGLSGFGVAEAGSGTWALGVPSILTLHTGAGIHVNDVGRHYELLFENEF